MAEHTTNDTTPEPYDLEAVYDAQIAPLVDQLIAICEEHRMPMLAAFVYAQNEHQGSRVCATTLNAYPGRVHPKLNIASTVLEFPGAIGSLLIRAKPYPQPEPGPAPWWQLWRRRPPTS